MPLALAVGLGLVVAAAQPSPRDAELVEVGDAAKSDAPAPAPQKRPSAEATDADASAPSRGETGESGESGDDGFDFDFGAMDDGFSSDAVDLGAGENAEGEGASKGAAEAKKTPTAEGDAAKAEKRKKVDLDKVFGGSLRLTGAYLHFDDEPYLFPTGDDGLGVAVGRVTVDADAGEHVSFEVNGFVDLTRSPLGSLSGAFSSAGQTASVYRTEYLGATFWENGAMRGTVGLDRAAATFKAGPVKLDVGRLPINYSVTGLFAPNDFYAPFSATAVNRIYKPGVDAMRLSIAAGMLTTVDVVGVLGYDDDGVPSWARSSVLTRAGVVAGGFEWGALGGKVAERWVVGGSTQGDAGPIGLRGEFHVGFPDADADADLKDDEWAIHVRAAGGPNVSFAWHNTTLSLEYMYISDGAKTPSQYLGRTAAIFPDTVPFLARHYISPSFGLDVVPILRAATFALVNANDGSGLAGGSLVYNVADESDFILGLFVPWGAGLQGLQPSTGLPRVGSEYGLTPLVLYLESRVFF
ncbi:MAG: hypothetical protein R3A79_10970 [Nannocystaceae bacterium]